MHGRRVGGLIAEKSHAVQILAQINSLRFFPCSSVLLTFCFYAGRAEFRQTRLGKMMKHRIIKPRGPSAASLFHHSVLHHFAIPVLAALGCGYPALGLPWFPLCLSFVLFRFV